MPNAIQSTVITAPNNMGMVTVDFERRVFRPGYSTTGMITSKKPYVGRGWRDKICMDAIKWLSSILK